MATGSIGKYVNTDGNSSGRSIVGQLFLTKMLKNPHYRTTVTLPGTMGQVVGFCEGPFSFSGSADWKSLIDLGQIEDQVSAAYALTSTITNQATGNENSQLSFKQVRGTELRYSGSGTPTFQFKLILPSYDPNASLSPLQAVRLLYRCVFPEYTTTESGLQVLKAPLGYGITSGTTARQDVPFGTVTITRGKFFKAPNMLIRQVSTEFSQECMEDGKPLYINANIEAIPWRCTHYEEAMSWIRG